MSCWRPYGARARTAALAEEHSVGGGGDASSSINNNKNVYSKAVSFFNTPIPVFFPPTTASNTAKHLIGTNVPVSLNNSTVPYTPQVPPYSRSHLGF